MSKRIKKIKSPNKLTDHVSIVRAAASFCGSQKKLALRIGELSGRKLSQQAVSKWIKNQRIPVIWVLPLSRATYYQIPPWQIEPDYYRKSEFLTPFFEEIERVKGDYLKGVK